MTLTQFSHPDPAQISALNSGGFDRNPSSSEGLDPNLSISPDWRETSAVFSAPKSFSPPDILLLYWTLEAENAEAKKTRSTKRRQNRRWDQFMLASLDRPARFKWQQQFFERPAARRDVEKNLRKKWLTILEGLLRGTKTPIGERLVSSARGSVQLLAGRRASTLRSRVRIVKRYLKKRANRTCKWLLLPQLEPSLRSCRCHRCCARWRWCRYHADDKIQS